MPVSSLTILKNVIRMELRKQFHGFRSAALLVFIGLIASFFLRGSRGLSFAFTLSGFLFALILGISAGQKLRDYSEVEEVVPVSDPLRVAGVCLAGFIYLCPVVFIYIFFQIGVKPSQIDWILPSIYKLFLICFMTACWIRLPVLAASIALLFSLVDILCSFTLWSIQQDLSSEFAEYGAPIFLMRVRLLLDVILVVLALYTTARAIRPLYGKKGSAIALHGLGLACVFYGPATSWFIFEFLLTPGQHQSLPWAFPFIVIFRIGNILYQ